MCNNPSLCMFNYRCNLCAFNNNQWAYTPISFLPRQYYCKKCGNINQDKFNITFEEDKELLIVECKRCGYLWREDTSDKNNGKKE